WERSVKASDGTANSSTETPDVLISLGPDGTKVTEYRVIDIAFRSQSMVPAIIDVQLPSGRTIEYGPLMRWKTFSDMNNVLSLDTWRDEINVNGRIYETAYRRSTNTITTTTPMGRTSITTLDQLGRPIALASAGMPIVSWTYDKDGHVATVTQSAGDESRSEVRGYNDVGWLQSRTNPNGELTSYAWDQAGRLSSLSRADGSQVSWQLDPANNVTRLSVPGGTKHQFEYDPNTKLLTRSTPPFADQAAPMLAAGQQIYEYGAEHELTAITRSDARSIRFAYRPDGKLSTQTLSKATLSFGYDAAGVLTSVDRSDGVNVNVSHDGPLWTGTAWSGAVTGSVKADYDADLWLKSLTVNDKSTVSFSYDKDGLLLTANAGPNATMTVTRDASTGWVTGTSLGNVITANTYNAFGELSSLLATASGKVVFSQSIERDKLGRVIHIAETMQGAAHDLRYSYDNLGRLTTAARDGVTTTYEYDPNGNRTLIAMGNLGWPATYDDQDRILTHGSATFEMTPHGDLLRKTGEAGAFELSYDELGNLLNVTASADKATQSIAYVVDGFGRRVARKVNGQFDKAWLYRDQLRPVSEVDSAGTFKHFVYAVSQDGAPDFLVQDGLPCRVIKDHLGSVRLLVDAQTGEVVQALEYDPYGVVLSDTSPGFQPFGFAGGLYDADTKLVRFGARDYSPGLGRWTNKDPIGFAGGDTNVYAYVGGDPVNRRDPTGLAVYLCSRIAELDGNQAKDAANGYRHLWIWASETGSEAGMGPNPRGWRGIRGVLSATMIVDHRGAHNEKSWKDVRCKLQESVDEACVDRQINESRYGKSLGPWFPLINDCGTFAASVLSKCHRDYATWLLHSTNGT
ncbi:MAG TPA: RHS repeat-associated core domain-containing protein, partial [Polyangiaceae bacterium]|nr:RHS repeat-associated core domain-containing protein [Polyangiaceae bacterium]